MRIPKDEVLVFVIRDVMQKKREINSLTEFSSLVNRRLKRVDPKLAVSGKRLRQIFVKTPGTKLVVETKKGRKVKKCPACYSGLKSTHTKNLKGKKVLYKMKCNKCGFSAVNGKFKPRRYRFIKK